MAHPLQSGVGVDASLTSDIVKRPAGIYVSIAGTYWFKWTKNDTWHQMTLVEGPVGLAPLAVASTSGGVAVDVDSIHLIYNGPQRDI